MSDFRRHRNKKRTAPTGPHRTAPQGPCGKELLRDQLHAWYGSDDAQRILDGSAKRTGVTLRANTLKASREDVARALESACLAWKSLPWYEDAFLLPEASERDIWALPAYEQGLLYMQSLSSMFPAIVLDAQAGEDILDMCAAPGGKTSQIAALSGGKAHITACEMHVPRAEKLRYNLEKLGVSHATVMQTDARRLDSFFSFDRILIDAPCSGSGTLDFSTPEGIARADKRFTTALIDKSVKSQHALLGKALELLKPGGTCVYSTCSVLKNENEEIVDRALRPGYEIEPIAIGEEYGLPTLPSEIEGCLTLCPTERYEGFFVARIKRIK